MLVHIIALLFDKFVPFTIIQVLVPFASSYKPVVLLGMHVGTLWVALGVIAFYAVAIVVITSLVWIEKKPYTWKLLHLLAYLIAVFVFFHSLFIGTDLAGGLLRLLWIVSGIGLLAVTFIRIRRAGTLR